MTNNGPLVQHATVDTPNIQATRTNTVGSAMLLRLTVLDTLGLL